MRRSDGKSLGRDGRIKRMDEVRVDIKLKGEYRSMGFAHLRCSKAASAYKGEFEEISYEGLNKGLEDIIKRI